MHTRNIAALTLSLALGLAGAAMAAPLPSDGLYVAKDGTPLSGADRVPPAVKKAKMAPQNQAVVDALNTLPHDAATVVTFTVNEDGAAVSPAIAESSGSIILDQYAMESVNQWQFTPAKIGDTAVAAPVSVPIRFVSTLVAVPAAPVEEILKEMTPAEQEAANRAGHPAMAVKLYVNAGGTRDGKPEAQKADGISTADFKILAKYAERSVADWTFTPAQNPDGEAIGAETVVTIQV